MRDLLRRALRLLFWDNTVCRWLGHDWRGPPAGADPDLVLYCPHCLRWLAANDMKGDARAMTDHDLLLRAVLADPAHDAVRLVYADWCEEYGDPARAEFVRAQIELASLECPWSEPTPDGLSGPIGPVAYEARGRFYRDRRASRLVLRGEHLQGRFGIGWSGIPALANVPRHSPGEEEDFGPAWHFRRGFVESVSLPLTAYLQHAATLFAAHPITSVTLADREPDGGPHAAEDRMFGFWRWQGDVGDHGQPADPAADNIPPGLWDAMKAQGLHRTDVYDDKDGWLWFESRELAITALARAAVAVGRERAGLPPLDPAALAGRAAARRREA